MLKKISSYRFFMVLRHRPPRFLKNTMERSSFYQLPALEKIFFCYQKSITSLPRYEQIDESSSSVNVSTDSCVKTLIPESDDFFPKCDTLSIGTQTTKKNVEEKKEHNIKCCHKEQVYSDRNHYHLQYDKHTNNATSLHLSGTKEKGQH